MDETFERLGSTPEGITEEEARHRLVAEGPNELQKHQRVSPWTILLEQFKNVLIIVLLMATLASGLLGHGLEAIVIAVIVLFAILLGFIQEYRAERAIDALRRMTAPTATVIRSGREMSIPAYLTMLNSIEPPWYVTRMPGGVGGVEPRGFPLSRSGDRLCLSR